MDFLEKEYNKLLESGNIPFDLYEKLDVKRGLRNINGTGVRVGLTKVSDVQGYELINNVKTAQEGHLYYRGYDLYDIAKICSGKNGYEKACFLILFGHFPDKDELIEFTDTIKSNYLLPTDFVENIILRNVSSSLMNHISRATLSLYTFDKDPDNTNPKALLEKGISIIAKMPAIIAYSWQAKRHYLDNKTLHIRNPKSNFSIAENILHLSKNDGVVEELDANVLDLALILHADHGGGNNSTFTNVVVSSTDTDLYSTLSAGIGSLKGPRHGGANGKALDMMMTIIKDIGLNADDEKIGEVIDKILAKQYYDKTGLLYGFGHAVYTKSDPRCQLLENKCRELADKYHDDNFYFYKKFKKIALNKLSQKLNKEVCANVDYYSGLTYKLLNISEDLFTPIFATSRMVGWIAHVIENKLYCDKIIRPATLYVGDILQETV